VNAVIPEVQQWFIAKEEYIRCFATWDTRVEGWFKGELLMLLDGLKRRGLIGSFEREKKVQRPTGRVQVDFAVEVGGETHLCEIKALCISQALGTPRNLSFYLREDKVGLVQDLRKLDALGGGSRWLLAFVYPNPGSALWCRGIATLPPDLSHWRCNTKPESYPDHLFLSAWRPEKK
jgi:hypothetical protein